MQSAGAIAKPAKVAAVEKPQADTAKSQIRQSTAAALADAGKAVSHVFADRKVVSALPVTKADPAKPDADSAGAPAERPTAPTAPSQATANAAPAAQGSRPAIVQAPAAETSIHVQPQAVPVTAGAATAVPPAPAATANAAVSVQLQIGHPAHPDIPALAFNIASKAEGGTKHFDIRLDPAELGRVDVRLTVDDAGKAQATLSVEKPRTLELLQKDQPQLERALKDAGLDLSQNGLNFSLKGQQQQQAGGNAPSNRGRALAARAIAAVDSAASTVSLGQASPGDARLDIRV